MRAVTDYVVDVASFDKMLDKIQDQADEIKRVQEQRDTAVRRARKLADWHGIDWAEDPVLSTEWAEEIGDD